MTKPVCHKRFDLTVRTKHLEAQLRLRFLWAKPVPYGAGAFAAACCGKARTGFCPHVRLFNILGSSSGKTPLFLPQRRTRGPCSVMYRLRLDLYAEQELRPLVAARHRAAGPIVLHEAQNVSFLCAANKEQCDFCHVFVRIALNTIDKLEKTNRIKITI